MPREESKAVKKRDTIYNDAYYNDLFPELRQRFYEKYHRNAWIQVSKTWGDERTKQRHLYYIAEIVGWKAICWCYESTFSGKSIWIKREFHLTNFPKGINVTKVKGHPLADVMKQGPPSQSHYRISGDYSTEFGDGGRTNMAFPVWVDPKIDIEEKDRLRIVELLRQLSEKKKDFHTNSPVKDIIDPDLFPCVHHEPGKILSKITDYKKRLARGELHKDIVKSLGVIRGITAIDEEHTIRDNYHWVPTTFKVYPDDKVEILSPINGIADRSANEELYELIANVFSKMLHLFKELSVFPAAVEPITLQVIVKAQEYDLKPGMTYAGKWHTEGRTEHIIASGVYYAHVGEMEGGKLKFRPQEAPHDSYRIATDQEATSRTGTGIAFSNTIPHRFRKISNLTDTNQQRTFINFFIVDPRNKLSLPVSFVSKLYICLCLNRWAKETSKEGYLPSVVVKQIIGYFGKAWKDEQEAKQFRTTSREAMLKTVSGWGYIGWGNCGVSEFVTSKRLLKKDDQEEISTLVYTESE